MAVFVGFIGYVGLLAALATAMVLAGRGAATVVGLRRFRWFDAEPSSAPWWKQLVIRVASASAPLALSVLLFWVGLLTHGLSEPGPGIEVLPASAAEQAGLRNGDRITAVAGQDVATWEAMRSAIQRSEGATSLRVEREGRALAVEVTPRAGRIGVTQEVRYRAVGAGEALPRALAMPLTVVKATAEGWWKMVAAPDDAPEVAGPVEIVKEASTTTRRGNFIWLAALLAASYWLQLVGAPFYEWLSAYAFRFSHPGVTHPAARGYRLARQWQGLWLALAGAVSALVALALLGAKVPLGGPLFVAATPAAALLLPVLWHAGTELWGAPRTALLVALSATLPCVALAGAVLVFVKLKAELRREGFRVLGVRTEPEAATPHNAA